MTRSKLLAREGLERLLAVARGDDLVALLLEREAQQLEDRLLVVDEQDPRPGLGHHGLPSRQLSRARGAA